jgi:hypothetical protein
LASENFVTTLHRGLSVVALCLLAACGAPTPIDPGTNLNTDGGAAHDAGSHDAGHHDGGTVHHDGGTTHHPDAGPSPTPDAGPSTTPDAGPSTTPDAGTTTSGPSLQTVFVILMENHNWSDIHNSSSAPYIASLLLSGAHAENYYNPPGNHPSEPNYLWLEAGTNFGILNDKLPSINHQSTTAHLVTQLDNAGIGWKSYQEDISGSDCPLVNSGNYAPKHNAPVFFDDITNSNDPQAPACIAHVRPYSELATDLAGTPARYNFITPNLCNDMHNSCAPTSDKILQGDNWLSTEVPKIMASAAYQSGGVIFITWDESEQGEFPIGLIVLSPFAKVNYSNMISYTHSSLLRTNQEILGVRPFLGGAANATDLSDLFTTFP